MWGDLGVPLPEQVCTCGETWVSLYLSRYARGETWGSLYLSRCVWGDFNGLVLHVTVLI